MVSKYTEIECNALDEKFKNPENTVICPRCGERLQYKKIGNSGFRKILCKSPSNQMVCLQADGV